MQKEITMNVRHCINYACAKRGEDKDALEIIKTLLDNGADPNAICSPDGSPIIQSTVVYPDCYFRKAQLLEDYGAILKVEIDDKKQDIKVEDFQGICQANERIMKKEYEELNKERLNVIGNSND